MHLVPVNYKFDVFCVAYIWILNSCDRKKYHKKSGDLFAFGNFINYLVSFLEKMCD